MEGFIDHVHEDTDTGDDIEYFCPECDACVDFNDLVAITDNDNDNYYDNDDDTSNDNPIPPVAAESETTWSIDRNPYWITQ